MVKETVNSVVTSCRKIAYYLPSIETEVSPAVAAEIEAELHNIERLTKHMHETECAIIQEKMRGASAHGSSSPETPVHE